MKNSPRAAGSQGRLSHLPEDWHLARDARLNLLLIHHDGVNRNLLELLLQDLHEPIARWRPGEQLVLPPVTRDGTMVLHDVGALEQDDQYRLLDWLERAVGRTQVVSTTPSALLPRVKAGAFSDTLYYRLNTVCLDMTAA
jgi:hypothetical protein